MLELRSNPEVSGFEGLSKPQDIPNRKFRNYVASNPHFPKILPKKGLHTGTTEFTSGFVQKRCPEDTTVYQISQIFGFGKIL